MTLACGDYDRVAALKDGRVQPEGVCLNFVPLGPEEIFFRMARYQDFDAAEMSLASYICSRAQGKDNLIAIPVFPSRMFRHSAIYVNRDTGIRKPEEIKERRVGLPEFQMTALVWMKGILSDDYGVKVTDVTWYTGGLEQAGREERVPLPLPPEIRIQPIPEYRTLSEMLEEGELDAIISARAPSPFLRGSKRVKRLFDDFVTVEQDYFRRTSIFPIMHTMVIRKSLYDTHPWLALSLYKAFNQAQSVSLDGLHGGPALRYSLAWLNHYWEQERELLGADAWANGVEKNRKTVETLMRYLVEQRIVEKAPRFETLFAPSTFTEFKI
ncbi:MAG: ABC transporter substrate-binding protein [Acidobacteria bacterium]|nr:ABC transporter substrate-binding protein [Acidobacteriota bacterium]